MSHILTKFQFHKGTIRTLLRIGIHEQLHSFQFHKGTIRTFSLFIHAILHHKNFNSIKVRLELYQDSLTYNHRSFQFHKGTIRTRRFNVLLSVIPYFNSIKVRLELCVAPTLQKVRSFQFHKGTIRTRTCLATSSSTSISIP